jgi:hypothetical protein
VADNVSVTGWTIEIHLRIPLDEPDDPQPIAHANDLPANSSSDKESVSNNDRLRSVGGPQRRTLSAQ